MSTNTELARIEAERMAALRAFCRRLPHRPGVYRMLSNAGDVLYVGKARDLNKRVSSYFSKSDQGPRITRMIAQIDHIETTVTRSEAEALLLESNLIKSLSPRYNILFRDDKSYPYIRLSGHLFPQISLHRGSTQPAARQVKSKAVGDLTVTKQSQSLTGGSSETLNEVSHVADNRGQTLFGPYPSVMAVRQSIEWLQRIFRLRTCDDTVFQNRSRPCLLHQIHRCTGPCVDLISALLYQQDVQCARLFLQGRADQVLKDLEQRMHAHAEAEEYEQAVAYRDRIFALNKLRASQYVVAQHEQNVDVIAVVRNMDQRVCVNRVSIWAGQHIGDKSYFPEHIDTDSLSEILEAFLIQHYVHAARVPDVIVIGFSEGDVGVCDWGELSVLLSDVMGHSVLLVTRPHSERRAWLEMALTNACLALEQSRRQHTHQSLRLQALHDILNGPINVQRIECFDISHTGGEATVAACVVYEQLAMNPAQYRRFNISEITPGDDLAAIYQAVYRRYCKILSDALVMPDMVLIDGGKLQLAAAAKALSDVGLLDLPVLLGIAKGEGRKTGLETIFFVNDEREPLQLGLGHPALMLLADIRDEAHRFAITGHRARRSKKRLVSKLDELAGVGPKRKQKLLTYFGSLRAISNASVDDLCQVEGISRTLAQQIYQQLH